LSSLVLLLPLRLPDCDDDDDDEEPDWLLLLLLPLRLLPERGTLLELKLLAELLISLIRFAISEPSLLAAADGL